MSNNLKSHLIAAGLALALANATAAAWYFAAPSRAPKMATVEIKGLIDEQEKRFTALLQKPGVTDAERRKAVEDVQAFGKMLDEGVKAVSASCDCVILIRAAVLTSTLPDYTAQVRQYIGGGT